LDVVGVVLGLAEQRSEVVIVDRVIDEVAVTPWLDEPTVAQEAELVRHRGLRDARQEGQVAHAQRSFDQRIHDPGAGWVGKSAEGLDHHVEQVIGRNGASRAGQGLGVDG
jgi:hypothetical protein